MGKSADSEGDVGMKCHIGKYGLEHAIQHLNFCLKVPEVGTKDVFVFDPLTANRVLLFRVLEKVSDLAGSNAPASFSRACAAVQYHLLFVTFLDQLSTSPK
jgi:hypothetical protein